MTPSLVTALLIVLVVALSVPIERLAARPERRGIALSSLLPRAILCTALFCFWLGIFGRPLLAAFASLVTIACLVAVSWRKRQLVAEPLVFSDFALLRMIVRHPDLYYLGFMRDVRFVAGVGALAAALGLWLWLEPPILAVAARIALALGIPLVATVVMLAAGRPPLADAIRRWPVEPDLERHVGELGLLATLATYTLLWRAGEEPRSEGIAGPLPSGGPDLVVVLQLESFIDPVVHGMRPEPLPGWARLRARAAFHGPLLVPAHGAFTMRTEYAILTGDGPDRSRFRQFDPYLSSRPSPTALARRLAAQGWRTLFMHPFRANFFDRDRVVPRLGFGEALWEGDFAGAPSFGPYVSDEAVVARILAEAEAAPGGRPQLIVAVTMENHGPWSPGRLPDESDPTHAYLGHLANSDRALARLADALAARPGRALLCVYGDHPPILPGIDREKRPETVYAVLELGQDAPAAPAVPARTLTAAELGRLLVANVFAPSRMSDDGSRPGRVPDSLPA